MKTENDRPSRFARFPLRYSSLRDYPADVLFKAPCVNYELICNRSHGTRKFRFRENNKSVCRFDRARKVASSVSRLKHGRETSINYFLLLLSFEGKLETLSEHVKRQLATCSSRRGNRRRKIDSVVDFPSRTYSPIDQKKRHSGKRFSARRAVGSFLFSSSSPIAMSPRDGTLSSRHRSRCADSSSSRLARADSIARTSHLSVSPDRSSRDLIIFLSATRASSFGNETTPCSHIEQTVTRRNANGMNRAACRCRGRRACSLTQLRPQCGVFGRFFRSRYLLFTFIRRRTRVGMMRHDGYLQRGDVTMRLVYSGQIILVTKSILAAAIKIYSPDDPRPRRTRKLQAD